jgi:hypothetical protein
MDISELQRRHLGWSHRGHCHVSRSSAQQYRDFDLKLLYWDWVKIQLMCLVLREKVDLHELVMGLLVSAHLEAFFDLDSAPASQGGFWPVEFTRRDKFISFQANVSDSGVVCVNRAGVNFELYLKVAFEGYNDTEQWMLVKLVRCDQCRYFKFLDTVVRFNNKLA